MSPIFVRPVREQLEHDRLIRFLAAKYKRKSSEVAVNIGDEQTTPVKIGTATFYPDLVQTSGRKYEAIVEVETGESVNNLEAMAQWAHFAKLRAPFHLYVPVTAYDAARRFSEANHAHVTEIWTYRATNDGFDLVRMFADAGAQARAARVTTAENKAKRVAEALAPPAPPAVKVKAAKPAAKPAKLPSNR